MWKKLVGAVLGVSLPVPGGAFAYLSLRQPASRPARDVRVAMTPERVARGQYLFNLADCGRVPLPGR
ncbi:MAG: hypothetical protein SGI92_29655 [Bryobacteraceae bacterium]|nr:hypothetical protein [Bryobacteraceae bacterium]